RRDEQLFPHDVRPRAARVGLLVRGEDGAEPLAGARSPERRRRAEADRREPRHPADDRREEEARGDRRGAVSALHVAQAAARRDAGSRAAPGGRRREAAARRARRRVLGAPELAGIPVQPLSMRERLFVSILAAAAGAGATVLMPSIARADETVTY